MKNYENLNLPTGRTKDVENIDGEIWKEIIGYNGDYMVSNLGRVKSFKRYGGTDVKILSPFENNKGYLCVKLCKNGEGEDKQIHRLMYETHIEKIPKGCIIHHIDFTKNNYLENFEMMNKSEHTILHHTGAKYSEESKELMRESHIGKHPSEKTKELMRETRREKFKNGELNLKGENHPMFGTKRPGEKSGYHILTEQKVIEIRKHLDEGILTQAEIGKMFGVCRMTISLIKNRKIWKHIIK